MPPKEEKKNAKSRIETRSSTAMAELRESERSSGSSSEEDEVMEEENYYSDCNADQIAAACPCDCEKVNKGVLELVDTLTRRVSFLEKIIVRLSSSIEHTKDTVTNLQSHSMKDNLIISGIKESDNEDAEAEVINFVTSKLGVELKNEEIVKAHRLGDNNNTSGARPLVVKFNNGRKKEAILSKTMKLKGKKGHNDKPLFISTQQPEAIVEREKKRRFKLKQLHAENNKRPKAQRAEIRVSHGKILMNNSVVQPKVCTPTLSEMLDVDEDKCKKMNAVKFVRTNDITDSGSTFFAYACPVKSIPEVRTAYLKAKLINPDSADVMASYSITYQNGKKVEDYLDDKEVGSGSRIFSAIQEKKMTNVAVFVVRYWNRTHIGQKRFKHIKDSALAALTKVAN